MAAQYQPCEALQALNTHEAAGVRHLKVELQQLGQLREVLLLLLLTTMIVVLRSPDAMQLEIGEVLQA
jgi:hypothetical protein